MALPAIHFRIGRPDFEIAVAAFRSVRAALPLPLAGPPELHLDAGAVALAGRGVACPLIAAIRGNLTAVLARAGRPTGRYHPGLGSR